jgi:hypothetical protein
MQLPEALRAYLARIGAREKNFRRFVVGEKHGRYVAERAVILIVDGKVRCDAKEYQPTEAEATAIEEALKTAKFPRSIGTTDLSDLNKRLGASQTHVVWDRAKDQVVMVQQTVFTESGDKTYVPWTFWDDGEWRAMEPDDRLPFFKPRKRSKLNRCVVHEGAKAAAVAERIATEAEFEGHPWRHEFALCEHWGMLGGAYAAARSRYDELRRERFSEVYYFCDNDNPGHQALQEFSRHYKGPLIGIRPDDRFPESWDCADALPERFFRGDRYVGPRLEELHQPATRATERIVVVDATGKRTVTQLTKPFREEWLHVVTPEVFVHRRWPSRLYTAQEFNSRVGPYSDVRDTASLVQKDDSFKGGVLQYSPAERSGIYSSAEGGRFINTHVPSPIKSERISPKPWLEFMEHLIPELGDRTNLMRWCATLIARPDVKMHYGVLLISETQGVGKSTLGEKILAPLVGFGNKSVPSETDIVDSSYNYWVAHKRLAIVHEIYAGHSAKAYNRLKSVISDEYVSVSKKYMAQYEIENWIHVFACSNSIRALHLDDMDRRWFLPKVTERQWPAERWVSLFDWLANGGGLGAIRRWAEEFVREPANVVQKGERSPWSATKKDAIDESASPGMIFAAGMFQQMREVLDGKWPELKDRLERDRMIKDGRAFFKDGDVVGAIKHHVYGGTNNGGFLERPLTIRKIAKSHGWHAGPKRIFIREWGYDGSKPIFSDRDMCDMPLADLRDSGLRPVDPMQLVQQ